MRLKGANEHGRLASNWKLTHSQIALSCARRTWYNQCFQGISLRCEEAQPRPTLSYWRNWL